MISVNKCCPKHLIKAFIWHLLLECYSLFHVKIYSYFFSPALHSLSPLSAIYTPILLSHSHSLPLPSLFTSPSFSSSFLISKLVQHCHAFPSNQPKPKTEALHRNIILPWYLCFILLCVWNINIQPISSNLWYGRERENVIQKISSHHCV